MSLEDLYIIDNVFESLDLNSWMCGFQFRFSSIIMPSNLDDCTLVTFIVFMHIFRSVSAERLQNNI